MYTKKLLLVGISVLGITHSFPVNDIEAKCPVDCDCSLYTLPNVLCRGKTTLPRVLPQGVRSFKCADCDIARMIGDTYMNYTNLTYFGLAGGTHLIMDERNRRFLRSVPKLELEGYKITDSDFWYIVPGHDVTLRNISIAPTSVSSQHSPGTSAARVSTEGGAPIGEIGSVTTKNTADDPASTNNGTTDGEDISISPAVTRKDNNIVITSEASGRSNDRGFWLYISLIVVLIVIVTVLVFWWCNRRYRYLQVSPGDNT